MLAVVAAVLSATVAAAPADAVQIVTEPGTGATLSSSSSWWTVVQTRALANPVSGQWPCLTAGTNKAQAPLKGCGDATPDAVGSGVIRLVDYSGVTSYEEGLMVSPPITAADGLKLTFDADSVIKGYGANAASMVLVNGDVPVDTSTGQWYYGGYVDYARTYGSSAVPDHGLPNALAGVIMDSAGKASGSSLQTGCTGAPGNRTNAAVLLGPGQTTTGYCYIAGTPASTVTWQGSTRAASTHVVEVDVSPTGDSNPRFIVKVDGTERINVPLSSLSPAGYSGATLNNVSNYRFGLSATNEGDGHDVWNIQADSMSSTPPTLSVAASGHDIGLLAPSYQTVTVSNPNAALAEATPVTIASSLPTGVVVHSTPTGNGWNCSATVTGSSTVGCTYTLTPATALMQGQSLPVLTVPLTLTSAATAGSTTITYSATDQNPTPASNNGSETVQALVPGTPPVTVTESAGSARYSGSGQTQTFTYTVTNTSSTTVTGITVTDSFAGASAPSCQTTTLAAGASTTCTATYTTTQADVDERSVTTTAVAAGVNALNQPVTSPSGAVTVQGAPVPAVRLQATTIATRLAPAGGKLAFRYTVTNTGDTTVGSVRIGIATKHFGKISCPAQALAPGQSVTCTGSHTVTMGEWVAKRLAVAIRAVVDDPQARAVSSPTVRIIFTRNGVTK